jgi:hypothetical protein
VNVTGSLQVRFLKDSIAVAGELEVEEEEEV